jgi:deoxyribonuclease (pyrimidine dimer)
MTRINTIDPSDLLDQHLFAEYREITRISSLARPLVSYGTYCMGTGHMKFFYNKGAFLAKRLQALQVEMDKRAIWNYTVKQYRPHSPSLHQDWTPDKKAHFTNLIRLSTKLYDKPEFYRYYGKPVNVRHYISLVGHERYNI